MAHIMVNKNTMLITNSHNMIWLLQALKIKPNEYEAISNTQLKLNLNPQQLMYCLNAMDVNDSYRFGNSFEWNELISLVPNKFNNGKAS